MRISLLREFIILLKNLNFSKTAKQLYIIQSALSKHISALEQEVGAPLLVRNNQSVELTAIGKLVLEEVIAVVNRYDESVNRINLAIAGIEQELKIGYLDAHARVVLVSAIQHFESKFPQVNLKLVSYEYEVLSQHLKNEAVDIILTVDFDKNMESWCKFHPIYKDVLCVVVRPNHPLTKKQSIDLNDLNSERIILPNYEQFNAFAVFINEITERFSQNVSGFYQHVDSALLMIEAGQGVAIMPRMLEIRANKAVCFVPIKGEQYTFQFVAAWRKTDNNPLIKHFISLIPNK